MMISRERNLFDGQIVSYGLCDTTTILFLGVLFDDVLETERDRKGDFQLLNFSLFPDKRKSNPKVHSLVLSWESFEKKLQQEVREEEAMDCNSRNGCPVSETSVLSRTCQEFMDNKENSDICHPLHSIEWHWNMNYCFLLRVSFL